VERHRHTGSQTDRQTHGHTPRTTVPASHIIANAQVEFCSAFLAGAFQSLIKLPSRRHGVNKLQVERCSSFVVNSKQTVFLRFRDTDDVNSSRSRPFRPRWPMGL